MNKHTIVILCIGLLISACGTGSNPNDSGTNIGPYVMSISSERTGVFTIPCVSTTPHNMVCDKNYPGSITIGFSFQGTPNFYIKTKVTNSNINIEPTLYDFTYQDPFSGNVSTISGSCPTIAQASLSCNYILNTNSSLIESAVVNFIITGQAGESNIYTVMYK